MTAETSKDPPARLMDLSANPIKALSAQEAKGVVADLKDWGKADPAIAGLFGGDSPARKFIIAALTLSPMHSRFSSLVQPSATAT